MKRIVIYRLGSLGDTVIALPFFNRIAQLYHDSQRIVLTNVPVSSKAAPLLTVLGEGKSVHSVISYPIGMRDPRQFWDLRNRLRAVEATTLIYLMPVRGLVSVFRDASYFKLCGFSELVGLPNWRNQARVLIDPLTGTEEPECERLARALSALGPFNLRDPRAWDLHLDEMETARGRQALAHFQGRPFIAINMGGKAAQKDWGAKNWSRLLSKIAQRYGVFGLLVVGALEDSPRVLSATAGWQGPVVDACGKLAPRESAAAMALARVFIGHDSGPLQLASVAGVRCVGLFGDFNSPRRWHPYNGDNRIIHQMQGMAAITVEEVFSAVAQFLE